MARFDQIPCEAESNTLVAYMLLSSNWLEMQA